MFALTYKVKINRKRYKYFDQYLQYFCLDLVLGFDGQFHFGVKFNNLEENLADFPESLDYTIFPADNTFKVKIWNAPDDLLKAKNLNMSLVFNIQKSIDTAFLKLKNNPDISKTVLKVVKKFQPKEKIQNFPYLIFFFQIVPQNKIVPKAKYRLHVILILIIPFALFVIENNHYLMSTISQKSSGLTV